MIKFSWRVGVSCWVVGLFVSSALAQNPTLKLIPAAQSTQRCLGGPDEGELCGTTANCELDNVGAIHPDCQRVCGPGLNTGEPCSSRLDCSGAVCEQQCFCNRWITTIPQFFSMQIRGTNWSPQSQRLKAWQADVEWGSACDAIVPFGWEKPCEAIVCGREDDPPCPALYSVCENQECEGAGHSPECFSFICSPPPPCNSETCPNDYVFLGLGQFTTTGIGFTFKYGSLLQSQTGVPFASERYFGTMPMLPRAFADGGCGTVSIGLASTSVLLDEDVLEIGPLDLEGITLVMPDCIPTAIVSSEPARCSIDGRQGSEPDGSSPAGWTTIELKTDVEQVPNIMPLGDFTMREVPGAGIGNPTGILTNVPQDGWVTLTFPPTNPSVWTCIKFKNDSAGEVCLGGLPGDVGGLPDDLVGGDGEANAADVPLLIDCLTRSPGNECELRRCDMDRSGVCAASDLVRLIDLLTKAEGYSGLESTLPVCPNPLP